jgi:hypothetical protein
MSAQNQTWSQHRAQRMNNMEGLQPNPLVDMMLEELETLRHQLTDIVENLGDLILPEWSNALEFTNELHGLREAVEAHCLNRQWFSVHARIDGTVVMVTRPDICWVSQIIFVLITLSSWLTVMNCDVASMLLIHNMRQTA